MADEKLVEIIKRGTPHWFRWLHENLGVWPDLRGADLHGLNLTWIELHKADLSDANLSGAFLYNANLSGADLTGADLSGARLHDANFHHSKLVAANCRAADLSNVFFVNANLTWADFEGADLREANLLSAELCHANLKDANLTRCMIGQTVFGSTDLSTVRGLDQIRHVGPSEIGLDTIYRSKEKVPDIFLRGIGVSENFLSFLRSQAPDEFSSCFISYSAVDQEFAKRLHADLQQRGVRCWFAPQDLKIGEEFRSALDDAIHGHDKLLVLLSENSVRSHWVKKEVETAFERERKQEKMVLFPIRLDNAVFETSQAWAADIQRMRHIGDFCGWKDHDAYKRAFDRLLRDLRSGGKPRSAEAAGT